MNSDSSYSVSKSLQLYRMRHLLRRIAEKRGRGTELISLYIPAGRQLSEVMSTLREEYGKASNIKSRTTRKNVQDAIVKVQQRLKIIGKTPKNGLVIFCGAIPRGPPGSEVIETYVIIPPKPINLSYYSCDDKFYVEPLLEMLREKKSYGVIVIDNSEATIALITGRTVEIKNEITSGVGGKTRKGGQSARRYERLRESELNQYYKRVGTHASEIFLNQPELGGIILAGPGPTKEEFYEGEYLHYQLKPKIIAIVDTSYTGTQGVKEALRKAEDKIKDMRIIEEKKLIQRFLEELGKESGLAVYGQEEVERNLRMGKVDTLLISEKLDILVVKIKCSSCEYNETRNISREDLDTLRIEVSNRECPKCGSSLLIEAVEGYIDKYERLARETGSKIEIIGYESEEGKILYQGFGGIVAILRHA